MVVSEAASIGALLGKADGAFRTLGGSSVVFNLLRVYIFGRVLRTLEYPDGELITIKQHWHSVDRLRRLIAEAQPPPYPTAFVTPEQVKQISVWTAPGFTEPLKANRDAQLLSDYAFVVWSKSSQKENMIPRHGLKLETFGAPIKKSKELQSDSSQTPKRTVAAPIIHQHDADCVMGIARRRIDQRDIRDRLIDLAADQDPGLLALFRNFGRDSEEEAEFVRHATRLVDRRRTQKSVETQGPKSAGATLTNVQPEGRPIKPQHELANR